MAPFYCVEHFSNYSIAAFAEGFLVFFWPLTAYPLIFFKESYEVGLFFLFYPKNFFLFPLGGDSMYFYLLFLTSVFCFFPIPWILVDIRLVNIYTYIYTYILWGSQKTLPHHFQLQWVTWLVTITDIVIQAQTRVDQVYLAFSCQLEKCL